MESFGLRYRDPERRLAGVRLVQHAGVAQPDFRYRDGGWSLAVPCGVFRRLEYQLELCHPDGSTEVILDPDNPGRVPGGMGERSVLECPGYLPPAWLASPPAREGTWRRLSVRVPSLAGRLTARVWSPAEATGRVLVAHDGTDYERYAALARYSASGLAPAHHLALLDPGDRTDWYSANPRYARAPAAVLRLAGLRALAGLRPVSVVGLGASLGALAMLHAHMRGPTVFAGLFLQSGSFFRPRYDRHESDFARYRRIVRFTARATRGLERGLPVPTVLTCGLAEENLHNNRDMAVSLRRLGYPTGLVEVPDAHNFTAWRDALHPGLTDLLRRVWSAT